MFKALKIIKKLLIWIISIGILAISIISIFLSVYEDEIEQYAVEEINKYLDVQVNVQDIDLTFLSNFPYVSLDFQKVIILDNYETIKSDDTLFYATNLYLNFNLFDIYNGNYKVRRINAKKAVLKIKTDRTGEVNYNITKSTSDSTSSQFDFAIKQFKLSDFYCEYVNVATQQFYRVNIKKGKIHGDFSETEYNLSSKLDLYIKQLKTNSFTLVSQKNANLDLVLKIDNENNRYDFSKGDLRIEEMPFHITGLVTDKEIDLEINGNGISLEELSNSVIDEKLNISNLYDCKGQVSFSSAIQGVFASTKMPSISAKFSVINGFIKEVENNLSINQLNINGEYQNKQPNKKEQLNFSNFSMNFLGSHVEGSSELIDFVLPTFKGNLKGQVDLKKLHDFLNISSIDELSGLVQFNTKYAIKFVDIQYNPQLFDMYNTKGSFKLNNVSYQPKGGSTLYKNINGDIIVNGDDAAAKDVSVETQNSDIVLNGALKNLIPFIEGNGKLGLIATLESNHIVLDDFLGSNSSSENSVANETVFEIPDVLSLNLELNINKLNWENHEFDTISGKLIMDKRVVDIKHFKLGTLNGNISGNLNITNLLKNGNKVAGQFMFNGLNVSNLFKEWNDFGQSSITHKNIVGRSNGTIDLLLDFDPYFNILTDKMIISTNISILNGELNNLSTMKDITEYMRSNTGLKLALNNHIDDFENKLMKIQFDELQNNILIKDGKINIPKMFITSNAMDLTLSGWHNFANQIDYHFSFRFRELKTVPEYSEFGKVEDDGLGWRIYLSMFGDLDDPSYKLDKDERKATRKENITQEKETLKSILKSEIGLFSKDTTIKTLPKEKSNVTEFIMYDDETDLEQKKPTGTKTKKPLNNKKKTNKFFEKLKQAELKEREEETIEVEL